MRQSYVYIVASGIHGTLYVGVTRDPIKRVYEHKNNILERFTSKYGIHRLVFYEIFNDMKEAILREKQIKKWKRKWKKEFIEKENPRWADLWDEIVG